MDPNANLEEQRRTAWRLLNEEEEPSPVDAMRLAELVLALDEWLFKGKFKPERWR